jgi:hypothetical protein
MDTTAPTIRALELKEQQHRADVAELVAALDTIAEHIKDNDDTGAYLIARAMSRKHGA